ncbi:MAG: cation diffusion facilitator family transporter [Steroidobacteraceae bacterium]|jgi:cobalt-zinc-cadmium efflux system protein|nr:cation diffusion facilitator family transporter [Steroidobacteraceae bacterium]
MAQHPTDPHGHEERHGRGCEHGHGHGHGHGHHQPHDQGHSHRHDHGAAGAARLGAAFWLIAGFMVVEGIGGWISGSLALLADAGHMLVDTLALGLAWGAHRLARRPATATRSFGHSRLQVLAAFVNALLLLGIVVAIVIEAAQRLQAPQPIDARLALWVAIGGAAVNLVAAWLLHGGGQDLNVRAAYLHVLADLAGSAAAIVAALLVLGPGWLAADAWLSLVVAALIARGALDLLRRSAHVLQEGAPEGFDAPALKRRLVETVPAVLDVHHVHAWSLTPRETLLTLHARIAAGSDAGATLAAIKRVLVTDFRIEHSTVQLEPDACVDDVHGTRCADAAAAQEDSASRALR